MSDLRILEIEYDTEPESGDVAYFDGENWIPTEFNSLADSWLPVGFMGMWGTDTPPPGWLICNGAAVSRTVYAALLLKIGTTYGSGDGSTTFNIPNLKQRFPLGKADSGTGVALGDTGGSIDHTHTVPAHHHAMGTGADLNITSSGTHTTAIDHDHGSFTSGAGSAHNHGITDPGHTHSFSNDSPVNIAGTANAYQGATQTASNSIASQVTGISINNESAHTHAVDVPAIVGNSASTGAHTHPAGNIAGKIGLVTGGVDGNAVMATGANNPPFLTVNFIIWTGGVIASGSGGELMGILGLTYP